MEHILEEAKRISAEITEWRRHLHQTPELGLETPKTSAYIVQELKKMGVEEIRERVGGWGVAALVKGEKPGKTLAIRAACGPCGSRSPGARGPRSPSGSCA